MTKHKIPKKRELLELQKKYRTDRKIAEVYGVPARLVAYWRSKKKIPAYSQPKYSREKITEIWERYGNDKQAGAELGISGPGFRQWRLRYGLKYRPARLKYEQLELPLPEVSRRSRNSRRETMAQKFFARRANLKSVEEGQAIEVCPDFVLCGTEVLQVIGHFKETGATKVWEKGRIAIVLEQMPGEAGAWLTSLRTIREFARKQGIERLYDIGSGVSYQLAIEDGLISPSQFAVASNDHVLSLGCLGAFSTTVTPLDMGVIWATGRIWQEVPRSIRVVLKGLLGKGVCASDVILRLYNDFDFGRAFCKSVEFYGEAVSAMSIASRLALANLAKELKAKMIFAPFDEVAQRFLKKISRARLNWLAPDPDARYEDELEFDVSYLTPQVAGPTSLRHSGHPPHCRSVEEMAGKRLDQVVIGGCVGGGIDDLALVARILKGKLVARDARTIIVPSSRRVYLEAIEKGLVTTLVEAGCVVASPGCVLQIFPPAAGERMLSTTNCMLPGEGEVYLASPLTAAASAIEGAITDGRRYL